MVECKEEIDTKVLEQDFCEWLAKPLMEKFANRQGGIADAATYREVVDEIDSQVQADNEIEKGIEGYWTCRCQSESPFNQQQTTV